MTKDRITLLGTVHIDPSGEERLKRAIEILRPDWISVEANKLDTSLLQHSFEEVSTVLTPFVMLRAKEGAFDQALKESYQASKIWHEQGYERRVVLTGRIPFYEVDITPPSDCSFNEDHYNIEGPQAQEFSKEVCQLMNGALQESVLMQTSLAAKVPFVREGLYYGATNIALARRTPVERTEIVDEDYDLVTFSASSGTLDFRDEHMANRIREIAEERGTNGLHVGGLAHMFGKGRRNLYDRLKDDLPVDRAKLNWFK